MAIKSDMQKLFVKEYLVDLNATQAAIRAGYSKKTAMQQGQRLLTLPDIQMAVQREMRKREKRTEITADRVLQELAKIGFSDIKDFLEFKTAQTVVDHNATGEPIIDYKQVIDIKDSDEVDGTLINEVSISKDGTFKFKLHDKMAALEKMGKHLGMFKETVDVNIVKKLEDFM